MAAPERRSVAAAAAATKMSPDYNAATSAGPATHDVELQALIASPSPSSAGSRNGLPTVDKSPHKPRWLSLEFLVYYAWLAYVFYYGSTRLYARSRALSLTQPWQHRHLQPGWLVPDHQVDVADGQYRFFRNELPTLAVLAAVFLLASHTVRRLSNNSPRARLAFYFVFSLVFLVYVNGSAVFFMLAIVATNYAISTLGATKDVLRGRIAAMATWIFACAVLLANEKYHGYRWTEILPALFGTHSLPTAIWLDTNRGLFSWHGLFNLVVLRMISFNFDRQWAAQERPITERDGSVLTFEKHATKCRDGCQLHGAQAPCPWWREREHHSLRGGDYGFVPYFVYLFYVPLHFAGPTISFNSFLSCLKHPQRTYTRGGLIKYAVLRTLFIFLCLEAWLHCFYVFSLTNDTRLFLDLTAYEMAWCSYYTLIGIWLKFTCIWRFFRCWALLDGVEPPENMQRCVSNNYSIRSFWRAWHRSFNRWLVRYIYVPLGGGAATNTTGAEKPSAPSSKLTSVLRQSFNVFLTFSFVAFWHDRTMQLLAWGWLIALLFVPELTAEALFNLPAMRWIHRRWYWRHIRAVGASLWIFAMMVANLIGYSVGLAGTSALLQTMATEGVTLFVVVFTAFFAASNIMFECRATGITVD